MTAWLTFDDVIVGCGGSLGCVVANRFSGDDLLQSLG